MIMQVPDEDRGDDFFLDLPPTDPTGLKSKWPFQPSDSDNKVTRIDAAENTIKAPNPAAVRRESAR